MGGQTFWLAGRIYKKNSTAGRKKTSKVFELVFFNFKAKNSPNYWFFNNIISKNTKVLTNVCYRARKKTLEGRS